MAAIGHYDSISDKLPVEEVLKWATSMDYKRGDRNSMPTTKDFEYLCRGPMEDIVLYMIQHVQPIKTVKKVKGNVQYKRLHQQPHLQQASTKKCITVSKSAKVRNEEQAFRVDTDKASTSEKKSKDFKESLYMTLEKFEILDALTKKSLSGINYMMREEKELESFLMGCSQKCSRGKTPAYVPRYDASTGAYVTLETICMKSVRILCDNQAEFLKSAIFDVDDDHSFKRDHLNDQATENFRKAVEDILVENNPTEVLRCITEVTTMSDSARDSQNLPTPVKNSESGDMTFCRNLMQTMQVFAKQISLKTKMLLLKDQLDQVMLKIDGKLLEFCASNSECSFELAKKNILERISDAEIKAKSTALRSQFTRLEADLQSCMMQKDEFDRQLGLLIQEEKHMKNLQGLATQMLQTLGTRFSLFDMQRIKVRETLEGYFHQSKLESFKASLRLLHDRTTSEANLFMSEVPFHLLLFGKLPSSVTSQQLQKSDIFGNESSSAIHLPVQKLPNPLKTLRLKETTRRTMIFISLLDTRILEMNLESRLNFLTELSKKLHQRRKNKLDELLPKTSECAKESTKILSKSQAVMQAVITWWEQPAAKIELKLEIDGATLTCVMSQLGCRP